LDSLNGCDKKGFIEKSLPGRKLTHCMVQSPYQGELDSFLEFCLVDLRLCRGTALNHRARIRRILEACQGDPTTLNIRHFLSTVENQNNCNNFVKSLRIFFRDYLKEGELVESFRLHKSEAAPPRLYTRKELAEFYYVLPDCLERSLFILYATSGRRRNEILHLYPNQIDIENRTILPTKESRTKHTWYSFFNTEAADVLREYLKLRRMKKSRYFFSLPSLQRDYIFKKTQCETGLEITPRTLRFWFANEMARLGVPDRFIDAFQGRIPRSVLARHYTDYSLENLKAVYDKAGLKVLPQ